MSDECTLGTYERDPRDWGWSSKPCTCANCTEREAKVLAEANARKKALLALDQAMTDLHIGTNVAFTISVQPEHYIGPIIAADAAWQAARRFIMGGGA